MIANVNDNIVKGALCLNCKAELQSFRVASNEGHLVLYICPNPNCPKGGSYTNRYSLPVAPNTSLDAV